MPPPPANQSCGNCRYRITADVGQGVGIKDFCRRHPPNAIFDKDALTAWNYQTAWPVVDPDNPYHWCGEWMQTT